MSKKKLDISSITNELRGQSVYFPVQQQKSKPEKTSMPKQHTEASNHGTTVPRHHDTMQPSNHGTTVPQNDGGIFEVVRKAVKQIGKEAATQRLTLEEKQALDDIEYTYKRQGIKTSGNEIIRIATNYIVRDYRQNGEKSILAKVLNRLNS